MTSLDQPRGSRRRAPAASWSRAVLAWMLTGLAVGGCDCGGTRLDARDASSADAAPAVDAPFSARDAGPSPSPEPCATDIRRFVVDLPPLDDASRRWEAVIAGFGDRVLVAQKDRRVGSVVGRLTVADARTGGRLRANEAVVPLDGAPLAIRDAGGDIFEVLWAQQGAPFAAIVRHGPDGATAELPESGGLWIYQVHAASVSREGFLALAEMADSDDWHLVSITATQVRVTPLPLPIHLSTVTSYPKYIALADADARGIVFGAVPTRGADGITLGLTALRIDTTVWPPRVTSREVDRMTPDGSPVSVDAASAGAVVAMSVDSPTPGVRFYWLDDSLNEQARWQSGPGGALPLGSVGASTRGALAFSNELGIYVGVVDAPGRVSGGTRALVNGLGVLTGQDHRCIWESAPGALSIGFSHSNAEVVTLCGAR